MDNDLSKKLEVHANYAVEFAKKYQIHLDYSNESIEQVEKILADLHEEAKKFTVTDDIIGMVATSFGAYVGTTLIRNLQKGSWGETQNILYVQINDQAIYFPAKVYRRIKDGEGDNVIALYIASYNQHSLVPIKLNLHIT